VTRTTLRATNPIALDALVTGALRQGATAVKGTRVHRTIERDEHVAQWVGRRAAVSEWSEVVEWRS
jgi:hypothetical protein